MKIDYDTAAGPYARFRHADPNTLERLLQLGRLGPQSRVLEVGCGSGNYIAAIAEGKGCTCCGLEPSAGMLGRAQARSAPVIWAQGRAEALPYPADSFDLLFCVDVIHHVADIDAFLREAFRVLRPGGVLCIATDSEWTIQRRNPLSVYFPETIGMELARYPSIEHLKQSMLRAGFLPAAEEIVETPYVVENADAYREKAFSCLHLIAEAAYARGMAALCEDLSHGPIRGVARHALVSATKPKTDLADGATDPRQMISRASRSGSVGNSAPGSV